VDKNRPASARDIVVKKGKTVSAPQYDITMTSGEPVTDSVDVSLQRKKSPAKPPVHVAKKKPADADSSADEEEKADPEEEVYHVTYGVQWNVQLPFTGSNYYFAGANGKSQPWLIAVPAAWIAVQKDRSKLSFEFNPLFSFLLPAKTYRTLSNTSNTGDSVKITDETRQLHKLIGSALYVGYGYNIKNNWWLKGGLQMQWWRTGIGTSSVQQQQYAVNNPGQKSLTTNTAVMNIQSEDWSSFQKFQVNVNAEAVYTFKQWEAAFRIGLPVSPVSDVPGGPKNSLRGECIFRLVIHRAMLPLR
jgi:hypothetical protein